MIVIIINDIDNYNVIIRKLLCRQYLKMTAICMHDHFINMITFARWLIVIFIHFMSVYPENSLMVVIQMHLLLLMMLLLNTFTIFEPG